MELRINLFDPGMDHLHRAGLAGLFMTLKYFEKNGSGFKHLSWKLSENGITMECASEHALSEFGKFFSEAFQITKEGTLDFAAHRYHPMGDVNRIFLSEAIRQTYLQHNKQNKIPKKTANKTVSLNIDDKNLLLSFKPFSNAYAHREGHKLLFTNAGKKKPACNVKNWLYPGAAERHSGLSGTEIKEPTEKLLCLLFAPMATLYYRLYHRGADGKTDRRRGYAIIIPHVTDLEDFSRCYHRYLISPYKNLHADGLGDAAMSAMIELKSDDDIDTLGLSGCSVMILGTTVWSKQQQSRTLMFDINQINEDRLNLFDLCLRHLPNRLVVQKNKKNDESTDQEPFFIATSLSRGHIAENIAQDKYWYSGFWNLMKSSKQTGIILYEKGGLNRMKEEMPWPHQADKQFVDAIHNAIRNRYGALAQRATQNNEPIRFDKEFERMRTGFMRAKNAQTLRAELADFFARGGGNKVLRKSWQELLPLFSGDDWQRARDLALFALASYAGKGSEEIDSEMINDNSQGE